MKITETFFLGKNEGPKKKKMTSVLRKAELRSGGRQTPEPQVSHA